MFRRSPFGDGEFDVATANFMLYHVRQIDRALSELARVAPHLVATTNGVDHMREMWSLVGRDLGGKRRLFMVETGVEMLRRHFRDVRTIDVSAELNVTADEMRQYVANSVAHRELADRVPDFEGTRAVTASTAVFIATR
jgi:ubiquinone/menaquinone biosynthesis C-methylase UbiE